MSLLLNFRRGRQPSVKQGFTSIVSLFTVTKERHMDVARSDCCHRWRGRRGTVIGPAAST